MQATQSAPYRWARPGDVNAFFGLMLDNVVNLVILAGILVFVFGFPEDLVYKRMFPGTALGVMFGDLVYTTGELVVHPCVHTCVPDHVDFSLDARHPDPVKLQQVLDIVLACANQRWAGCRCEVVRAWNRDTVHFDPRLVAWVKAAAEEAGVKHQTIHSGAGHDAQFASYMLPTTMIFVQSKDGLSHCEPEYSSPEHCTAGATVMLNAVLRADAD